MTAAPAEAPGSFGSWPGLSGSLEEPDSAAGQPAECFAEFADPSAAFAAEIGSWTAEFAVSADWFPGSIESSAGRFGPAAVTPFD